MGRKNVHPGAPLGNAGAGKRVPWGGLAGDPAPSPRRLTILGLGW